MSDLPSNSFYALSLIYLILTFHFPLKTAIVTNCDKNI